METIYQVCYNGANGKVVVYETYEAYDAKCYIGECIQMGDDSGYYIVERSVKK